MAKNKIITILTSALLTGCASNPANIDAAYVSPEKYRDYDCQQLFGEIAAVDQRIRELHVRLRSEASTDQTQMAVGLFLFWPALFFLEGGDGPEAAEYAQLKGDHTALQDNASRRCQTPTGPALCDAYSSYSDRQACLAAEEYR